MIRPPVFTIFLKGQFRHHSDGHSPVNVIILGVTGPGSKATIETEEIAVVNIISFN